MEQQVGWAVHSPITVPWRTVRTHEELYKALEDTVPRRVRIHPSVKLLRLTRDAYVTHGDLLFNAAGCNLWGFGLMFDGTDNVIVEELRGGPATRNFPSREVDGVHYPEPCPGQPKTPGDVLSLIGVKNFTCRYSDLFWSADEIVSSENPKPSSGVTLLGVMLREPAPTFSEDWYWFHETHARVAQFSRGTTRVAIVNCILHNGERRMPQFSGPGEFVLYDSWVSSWHDRALQVDGGAQVYVDHTAFLNGRTPHGIIFEDRAPAGTACYIGPGVDFQQPAGITNKGIDCRVEKPPFALPPLPAAARSIYTVGPTNLNDEESRVLDEVLEGYDGDLRYDLGENRMDCTTGLGSLEPPREPQRGGPTWLR
ncbi:MAG: hypothetical protein KDD47_08535 [Acidobacteria bacterium]|nr:hypothetical protein [Acidobacteriota bacterium]